MAEVTLSEFRATLGLTWVVPEGRAEKIFSYWNNMEAIHESCDRQEVLHIMRMADRRFCFEIANTVREGALEQLEQELFGWARDEGCLTHELDN